MHDDDNLEYAGVGNTAVAAHLNFENEDYTINSLEVDVTRCAILGYPVKPEIIAKYATEHRQNHFWIPGADLNRTNDVLQTMLSQKLTDPVNAVLAIHGLYHLPR